LNFRGPLDLARQLSDLFVLFSSGLALSVASTLLLRLLLRLAVYQFTFLGKLFGLLEGGVVVLRRIETALLSAGSLLRLIRRIESKVLRDGRQLVLHGFHGEGLVRHWLLLGDALLDPRLLLDFFKCKPFFRVDSQEALDDPHRIDREERRDFVITPQDFLVKQRCLSLFKGKVAADHRVEGDPTGPNIDRVAYILAALDHLWRRVAGTSTSCGEQDFVALGVLVNIGKSKVDYFHDLVFSVQQQILGLQIAMGYFARVEELNALDELVVQEGGFFLLEPTLAHDVVKELATLGIFHDHVDGEAGFNDLVQLDNILVLHFLQDFNLPRHATPV